MSLPPSRLLLNSNYNSADLSRERPVFQIQFYDQCLPVIFKNSLKVEASAIDATMVEMTLISDNIHKGIDFLDGLISTYIENNLEEKNYLAKKTIEHLDFQLADISKSLGSSEQELQNIRRNSSVMNIDEKAGNFIISCRPLKPRREEIEAEGQLPDADGGLFSVQARIHLVSWLLLPWVLMIHF